jgi:hypothetical protein
MRIRPDPNARTAWGVAWHIANSDIHFLDGIADLKFNVTAPVDKPNNVAELVDWYDRNITRAADRCAPCLPNNLRRPSISWAPSGCLPLFTSSS